MKIVIIGATGAVGKVFLGLLPESNLEISTKLAGSTSGHIFLLDNINGLKSFTEHLLITNKIGKLIPSGEKKLTFNDLLISDIEVLPGTEYVMAMFFRDNNADRPCSFAKG